MDDSLLSLTPQIDVVPTLVGRAAFAQAVAKAMARRRYDCVALALPRSLKSAILEAVQQLPYISLVTFQQADGTYGYVPILPSDAMVEAIRIGLAQKLPLEFLDLESDPFEVDSLPFPDEYGVQISGIQKYYTQVAPLIPPAPEGSQRYKREIYLAQRLQELPWLYQKILFVVPLVYMPAIYRHLHKHSACEEEAILSAPPTSKAHPFFVHPDTLYFLTGELPYITYLYEKMRNSPKGFDKVDTIKELLLESRKNHLRDFPEEIDSLTPGKLQILLQYVRSLSLLSGRLTPSLYHLVVAAKGVGGDPFALSVIEIAKFYPFVPLENPEELVELAIDSAKIPGVGEVQLLSRLPTPPIFWKNLSLERRPVEKKRKKWRLHFHPWEQCSWPEEDKIIENFVARVRDKARTIYEEDQKRVEKFTSSLKDGLDIRQTLRNWHTGELYVQELPPSQGEVGGVVIIFEVDRTEKYPWCSTWQAEHQNESAISFYATDFREDMVGPRIGRSYYGGVLFIYPPKYLPDIWQDRRFSRWQKKEEKLLAACLYHADAPVVAYVAQKPPATKLYHFAKVVKKRILFLQISTFHRPTLRKIRKFHVLGGKFVRTYAQDYIR